MPARSDGTTPIIAHGAIYLRPPERDDLPLFLTWLNDARTARTLGMQAPISIPMEEAWFDKAIKEQGQGRYSFTGCLVADDRPIGTISFFDLDLTHGSAGLGIFVGKADDRGRGFGTDMLEALLEFGFGTLRLERIWLDVYDFNAAAERLYERVGFQLEGALRHARFFEGRFVDAHRMSMLSAEWRDRHPGGVGAEEAVRAAAAVVEERASLA